MRLKRQKCNKLKMTWFCCFSLIYFRLVYFFHFERGSRFFFCRSSCNRQEIVHYCACSNRSNSTVDTHWSTIIHRLTSVKRVRFLHTWIRFQRKRPKSLITGENATKSPNQNHERCATNSRNERQQKSGNVAGVNEALRLQGAVRIRK